MSETIFINDLRVMRATPCFSVVAETLVELTLCAHKPIYEKSGNHAETTNHVVLCALRFEELHAGVEWGLDETLPDGSDLPYGFDYYDAIEKFAAECIEKFPIIP